MAHMFEVSSDSSSDESTSKEIEEIEKILKQRGVTEAELSDLKKNSSPDVFIIGDTSSWLPHASHSMPGAQADFESFVSHVEDMAPRTTIEETIGQGKQILEGYQKWNRTKHEISHVELMGPNKAIEETNDKGEQIEGGSQQWDKTTHEISHVELMGPEKAIEETIDKGEQIQGGSQQWDKTTQQPTRELRVQEHITSMAVTADGEFICCTRDSVVMYSADGARSEFHAPPLNPRSPSDPRSPYDPQSQPDTLEPRSVAVHAPTGDLVVAYETRTWPEAVYLDVFSAASNTWSSPHSLGEGEWLCVAWTQAGRVAVGVGGALVLYDPTQHTEVWRRTVGGEISDVAMWGQSICCCHWVADSISVCDLDGARSRTFELQAPGRRFSLPVSVCEGGGGRLLMLHREEVGGRVTGVVTAWSGTGEYVRDVVTGLPDPDVLGRDCVRLHDNTLCVSLRDERRIVFYKLRPESSPSAVTP